MSWSASAVAGVCSPSGNPSNGYWLTKATNFCYAQFWGVCVCVHTHTYENWGPGSSSQCCSVESPARAWGGVRWHVALGREALASLEKETLLAWSREQGLSGNEPLFPISSLRPFRDKGCCWLLLEWVSQGRGSLRLIMGGGGLSRDQASSDQWTGLKKMRSWG